MPKAKSVKKINKKEIKKNNILSYLKFEESYISLIIGIIVVLLVGGGLVFFLKGTKTTDTSSVQYKPTIDLPQEKSEGQQVSANLPTSYQIKSGDDLWNISEKFYKSGYNWVDIAKANNLSDPGSIHVGNKLVIPNVKPIIVEDADQSAAAKNVPSNQISGSTYKVKEGDYLWDIAVRAYGDGYQWVKIARTNNLSDPNLIFSGNVLKIPR